MLNAAVRCGALVAVLVSATACSDMAPPTAPTAIPQTSIFDSSPTPQRPSGRESGYVPAFPAVTRPARIYVAEHWPSSTYHGSPLASRYVLYADGTFALQYSSANYPFFEYRGTYKEEADGLITFEWEGWGIMGPWGARGSLSDDSLDVRYNYIMRMTDFEDDVYVRER